MANQAVPALSIVIVGGGTAGWLSAGLLASRKRADGSPFFSVTVIEPPDLPSIGVGEGTWPTMRATLKAIGVRESDFLSACNASFKQGSKFVNWNDKNGGYYYHPFETPFTANGQSATDLWLAEDTPESFSTFTGRQELICEQHLTPKLPTTSDYAGVLNYGYHFDSPSLGRFLRKHCEDKLGVKTVPDQMTGIHPKDNGDIASIQTTEHGAIAGDFFVDCTGFRAHLLKGYYGIDSVSLAHFLPANCAVAAQVPYTDNAPIQSTTVATAQTAGWIWDVSLATRRGAGYVHSSEYISTDEAASTLINYLDPTGQNRADISIRELKFSSGHLKQFWTRNCAAIGLSSGFIEPLEASSIMLTEIAARALCDGLLKHQFQFDLAAGPFNHKITQHWTEVVDFLKLHYVLTKRKERFWTDNQTPHSIPATLQKRLERWQRDGVIEIETDQPLFPLESYQYVWYGMRGRPQTRRPKPADCAKQEDITASLSAYKSQTRRLSQNLLSNRALLAARTDKPIGKPPY